jgi:hypothetical protein
VKWYEVMNRKEYERQWPTYGTAEAPLSNNNSYLMKESVLLKFKKRKLSFKATNYFRCKPFIVKQTKAR